MNDLAKIIFMNDLAKIRVFVTSPKNNLLAPLIVLEQGHVQC